VVGRPDLSVTVLRMTVLPLTTFTVATPAVDALTLTVTTRPWRATTLLTFTVDALRCTWTVTAREVAVRAPAVATTRYSAPARTASSARTGPVRPTMSTQRPPSLRCHCSCAGVSASRATARRSAEPD